MTNKPGRITRAGLRRFGGGKYGVAPVDKRRFMGRTFDSKAERDYAEILVERMRLGIPDEEGDRIVEVVFQPPVILVEGVDVRPDFLVIDTGGAYYVDVKGAENERFRRVRKAWGSHGRLPLVIVKRVRGRGLVETETIEGGGSRYDSGRGRDPEKGAE